VKTLRNSTSGQLKESRKLCLGVLKVAAYQKLPPVRGGRPDVVHLSGSIVRIDEPMVPVKKTNGVWTPILKL
jgi:hypothetical protein